MPAEFTMTVNIENAAFADDNDHFAPEELARILRKAAAHIEQGCTEGNVIDSNGNACGSWSID